ncbi:MAG: hypothetical protein ABIF82_07995 [Planctomycetota bacterium]
MPEVQISLDEKLKKINRLVLDIEDAKSKRDRKIGEKDSLMMTLRTQFDLDTLDKARKKVLTLDQQIIRRNEKVEVMFSELSGKYEI